MTTGMKQLMADVDEFHTKCGVPVLDHPTFSTAERCALRRSLIREESKELDHELEYIEKTAEHLLEHTDLYGVAKELADVIVVCVGTALELGIPLDRVWAEVHASNMTKSADCTRADGKILKGPDYRPPDIHRAIWGAGGEGDNG